MISTSDLKRGAMMELDGQIVQIISYEHQKIGRGSAQVRLKVKNIRTGAIFDTTAQAGPSGRASGSTSATSSTCTPRATSTTSWTRTPTSSSRCRRHQLGDAVNYLKDGMELEVLMYDDEPVGVDLPLNVVLEVTQTDPGFKGDTATGGNKPAAARDRPDHQRAAVRQHRRQDSRRHARRLLHRADVTPLAVLGPERRGARRSCWRCWPGPTSSSSTSPRRRRVCRLRRDPPLRGRPRLAGRAAGAVNRSSLAIASPWSGIFHPAVVSGRAVSVPASRSARSRRWACRPASTRRSAGTVEELLVAGRRAGRVRPAAADPAPRWPCA